MHITLIAITLLQISAVGSAVDFGEAGERMASAADGATYDPELLLLEEEEGWSTSFFVVVLIWVFSITVLSALFILKVMSKEKSGEYLMQVANPSDPFNFRCTETD